MSAFLSRWPRFADYFGLTGAALFAFGLGGGGMLIRAGLTLMLIACLLDWRPLWSAIQREPLAWLAAGLALYLGVWASLVGGDPGQVKDGLLAGLVHVGGLAVLIGWLLRGRRDWVLGLLALALAGLLIAELRYSGWAALASYLGGARADYGLGGNGPGVYFGTALLGLFSVGVGALVAVDGARRLPQLAWSLQFCLMAVLLTLPVLFNQSRAAWLAVLALIPLIVLAGAWRRYPARVWLTVLVALVAMAATVYGVNELVAKRIQVEQATVARIAEGQAVASTSSVGARVGLWQVALSAAQARPWFGHGPGSAPGLIDEVPELASYPHFHNLYLQVLVETGLVGLAGVALAYVLMLLALWRSAWQGWMAPELALFAAAAWLFYFVISLFQLRHDDIHGVGYLGLLMGITYTFWLHRPASTASENEHAG